MFIYQALALDDGGDDYHHWPVGVYLNRMEAVTAARGHKEWKVVEFVVGVPDNGTVIWDSYAEDCDPIRNPEYRKFYLRFWPTGFPDYASN